MDADEKVEMFGTVVGWCIGISIVINILWVVGDIYLCSGYSVGDKYFVEHHSVTYPLTNFCYFGKLEWILNVDYMGECTDFKEFFYGIFLIATRVVLFFIGSIVLFWILLGPHGLL